MMALLARKSQCDDNNVGVGRAGGAMKKNHDRRAYHCLLESCGFFSLDLLVVPMQSLSAAIGFNDDAMAYNAMTLNYHARERGSVIMFLEGKKR
jgi:hypothetical protein